MNRGDLATNQRTRGLGGVGAAGAGTLSLKVPLAPAGPAKLFRGSSAADAHPRPSVDIDEQNVPVVHRRMRWLRRWRLNLFQEIVDLTKRPHEHSIPDSHVFPGMVSSSNGVTIINQLQLTQSNWI